MTITTTHPPGALLDYSIDFTTDLDDGIALAAFEVDVAGLTLVSSARTGNVVSVIVSGGVAASRATIRMTGITDQTPARRHVQTLCLLVAHTCVSELAAP